MNANKMMRSAHGKTLFFAAVAGCMLVGNQVMATAPDKTLGNDSIYKYTDVTANSKNIVTTYSKNNITKNYDSITGAETASGGVSVDMPEYIGEEYNVSFSKAEYGHENPDSTLYFKYDTSGLAPKFVTGSSTDYDFKYNVDASRATSSSQMVTSATNGTDLTLYDIIGYAASGGTYRGAVFNTSWGDPSYSFKSVTGDFINNSNVGNYGGGAAISNPNDLGAVTGNFINNYVKGINRSWDSAEGGAIRNTAGASIASISGDFIGNYAEAASIAAGGAIYNKSAKIGDIKSHFFANHVDGSGQIDGGAIYNFSAEMGNIEGDFISNSVTGYGASGRGGAIFAYESTMKNITGDFINNKVDDAYGAMLDSANGGAIWNTRTQMGDINGNFIDNVANSWKNAYGGAIYNYDGKIGDIKNSNFIGNKVYGYTNVAYGGAIFNTTTKTDESPTLIKSITGDFINNQANGSIAQGGAIWNKTTIEKIHGDFVRNQANAENVGGVANSNATGGAIYNVNWSNEAVIKDLQGNFIENSANSTEGSASGGAIYNIGTIGNGSLKNSIFYRNSVKGKGDAKGGAMYNSGAFSTASLIDVKFIENSATSDEGHAMGGAIANDGSHTMGDITGDFVANKVSGYDASGGAIYNNIYGNISNIIGNFIGNTSESDIHSEVKVRGGGAIANNGTINDINASFAGNEAVRNYGGGILNVGNINSISGTFEANKAAYGGGISNITDGSIETISGFFKGNNATYYGGAIFNHKRTSVNSIVADFVENSSGKDGGAIWNDTDAVIGKVSGNFEKNSAVSDFYDTRGGAIYNNASDITIENSSFTGNYAKSKTSAKGGAIYSNGNTVLVAKDGYSFDFDGNYVEDSTGKRDEAIYVAKDSAITLKTQTGGQFFINDTINGDAEYVLDVEGDNTGKIFFNNHINNAHIIHNNSQTFIEAMQYFNNINDLGKNSLTMNSGTLNIGSLQLQPLDLNSLSIQGGTINIDNSTVDLVNKTMGRIIADNYEQSNGGKVYLANINLLNEAKENVTAVPFADESFKNTVECPVTERITPIFRYRVSYDTSNKFGPEGYFVFTRGNGVNGSNGASAYNPAVLAGPVAAQAGGYAAQTAAFDYVFEHADAFTMLSSADKWAIRNQNKYALAESERLFTPRVSDLHDKAMWVRPYTSFESISLNNGPKVDTISYGTLIGGDGELKELKNGWATISTAYVGYNGSSQKYSGVSTYQNGGLLGLTQTFYKGNFYTALTATAGASVGESHTMYGQDNFTMLMAGVASRSGYNFEFKEGRYILQPNWLMSYSYISTFDYTNAAGVRIDSDPLHAIQLKPSLKFIANAKNGWQPYASVGMVWNIMDRTQFSANGYRLPNMSIKPYVEYGVGVQKRWKDKCTGFLQAMIRNGGRTGIILTAGFRWALGREGKPIEKVENGYSVRTSNSAGKIIKQIDPAKKAALIKLNNQTRTANFIQPKQI